MTSPQNIVGPQIRTLRREKGLTQAMLAARCGVLGWDIGENTVTKIETQLRCVVDSELICLAHALEADLGELLPAADKWKATIAKFYSARSSRLDD